MSWKSMLQTLNLYFTRCCGVILILGGCYFMFVAIRYIDETIVRVILICVGTFSTIFGIKYLMETKKGTENKKDN